MANIKPVTEEVFLEMFEEVFTQSGMSFYLLVEFKAGITVAKDKTMQTYGDFEGLPEEVEVEILNMVCGNFTVGGLDHIYQEDINLVPAVIEDTMSATNKLIYGYRLFMTVLVLALLIVGGFLIFLYTGGNWDY